MGLPNVLTKISYICSAVVLLRRGGVKKNIKVGFMLEVLCYDVNVQNVVL